MSRLVFVDVETTGLDPERHDIWEVALVVRDDDHDNQVHRAYLRPDLADADPGALRVSRFYDVEAAIEEAAPDLAELVARHEQPVADWWCDPPTTAKTISRLTAGAHLVGASPAFDARFLEQLLRDHGRRPAWSHRLIDVEAMAAGALGWPLPRGLATTAEELGLEVDRDLTHGAVYDALLAMRVYDAVLALTEPAEATS